jgi:hypothetical protein
MKIPIKIGDKKYSIKPIYDLTTAEFIELSKIDDLSMIKYIAWATESNLSDAFFAVVSKSIENAIGKIPDVSKMSRPKLKYIDYSKTIETVGQRHQIESSNLSGYELLVFVLAVSQAKSNNIDDVNHLRDSYMQLPFTEILPAAFFLYKILQYGRNKEPFFLKRLRELMRILRLKKTLGLKG